MNELAGKRQKEIFTFKQFVVKQTHTAMKVGTDGVLLGAWTAGGKRVLDIGTGTGLIALMMAQRFKCSKIDAIEVNDEAYKQACENVKRSVFAKQINVFHMAFQMFYKCHVEKQEELYDAIVSNPPFFESSLKSILQARAQARHTDSLSFAELCKGVSALLAPNGVFCCILPTNCLSSFFVTATSYSLYLTKNIAIQTTKNKLPKRHLLAFKKTENVVCENTTELLMNEENKRSLWYAELTKHFYL